MKIIAQSTKASGLPYFHLAYLAANNLNSLARKVPVLSGGLILLLAVIVSVKSFKSSMSLRIRIAILTLVSVVTIPIIISCFAALLIRAYHPSASIYNNIGRSLQQYADKNDGLLPEAENWCDTLITETQLSLTYFMFDGGDVYPGESGFALNKNVAGKKLSEIPSDTVLLFETDLGHDRNNRKVSLSSRNSYESNNSKENGIENLATLKISEKRWNQSGGVEILTNRYNDGKGCDVFFADGHAEFVPAKKLNSLKW